jgi:hypothetical protein
VNGLGIMAGSEAVLAIFIGGTWWWVLRQQDAYVGWRRTASLTALALPTVALIVELVLAAVVAHYRSLEALDAASLHGGWSALGGRLWVWSFFATGLLSFCGLVLAIVGKGNPRVAAAVWSSLVLGSFFANLVLAVNSFH